MFLPDDNPVLTQSAVEKGQLSQLVLSQLVVALRQLHALGDHLTRETSVPGSMFLDFPNRASGSINQRYGSETFYHQAKILRKILALTVL